MQQSHHAAKLARYRLWFYAAAFYNLLWGTFNILFPHLYFDWIAIPRPNYLPLWQVVGMFVLVYAPAYWWAAQNPQQHYHLIVIGLLGKLLGPVGFVWSLATGQLPLAFGWTLLLNDLIWWPAFIAYLRDVRNNMRNIAKMRSKALRKPQPEPEKPTSPFVPEEKLAVSGD